MGVPKYHEPVVTPSLTDCLLELRKQSQKVLADMQTVIGIIDNVHDSETAIQLHHRLISLLGRESGMVKMMRRWVACLEPLDRISKSLE